MKRYNVILADPPWAYGSRCTWSDTKFGGGVHAHYPTMSTEDICALPVGRDFAAKDCALLLWVTGPHLDSGIKVVEAWGFDFKTIAFTWVKTTKSGKPFFGPGYYTASNTELVLLGVRGKMKPAANDVPQVLLEPHPRDEGTGKIIHSRKPAEIHRRIERLFGDVPRLEIFARVAAGPGWDLIGNQLAEDARELQPQRTLFDWNNQPISIGG